MSMYDMVDTTPEGYSEGEELSKMFSEDDMSEAFEERDIDVITEEINFYKQQAGMRHGKKEGLHRQHRQRGQPARGSACPEGGACPEGHRALYR